MSVSRWPSSGAKQQTPLPSGRSKASTKRRRPQRPDPPWVVDAMARSGRLEDARLTFEKMLTYANHVGLFAEEIGPTGEQLGNFPQAFTHLALISAGTYLDRALG